MPGVSEESGVRGLRLAYFVREAFPTYRVDVEVLFAQELASRAMDIQFFMQASDASMGTGVRRWHGGTVRVGPTCSGDRFIHRLWKHALAIRHELACLVSISPKRFDAIQVRDKIFIAVLASLVARLRGIPFYYWMSFPESESQVIRAREGTARYPYVSLLRGWLGQRLLYGLVMPLSRRVFVQSQRMKEDVMARGIPAARLVPVPMGIRRSDVRPQLTGALPLGGDTPRPFVIGHLGTIGAQRRLEVLIEALALLCARGLDAKLLFVGDGEVAEDRMRLKRFAAQRGMEGRMEITGILPRAEALERIASVDVGVSPFYPTPVLLSTSPTKLVEYFALGLPVVANDHPEQAAVLGESRAGLCVPWSGRQFARALGVLAAAGPEARRRLGERGRLWVLQTRTYDHIADSVRRAYVVA